MVTKAPMKPKAGRVRKAEDKPKTMASVTPSEAPPEMPRVYGSTSGLRKKPVQDSSAEA